MIRARLELDLNVILLVAADGKERLICILPLARSLSSCLEAAFDLKALCVTLVVGRWEWATAADILPSPPALKRNGNDATLTQSE